MKTASTRLYTLDYSDAKAYLAALLFIVGSMVLPQLFHLMPQGGAVWLPIYFFTLVGAYKYGWKVGLLTALLSPLCNSLLFGMPSMAVLPIIMTKSVLLAGAAGYAARRFGKVSLLLLFAVVLAYQVLGTFAEWALSGSLHLAVQDFRVGIPGMLLQIFGGYLFINYIIRR